MLLIVEPISNGIWSNRLFVLALLVRPGIVGSSGMSERKISSLGLFDKGT